MIFMDATFILTLTYISFYVDPIKIFGWYDFENISALASKSISF